MKHNHTSVHFNLHTANVQTKDLCTECYAVFPRFTLLSISS